MMARERWLIDAFAPGKSTLLTYLGAAPSLRPGPWLAHRDLVAALALANLSPGQRESLARSARVEWGREFGVGRTKIWAHSSGLPFGASTVTWVPRLGGVKVSSAWALGASATPVESEWLILRASPEWALDPSPPAIKAHGLMTLLGLGGGVLALVPTAVAAHQLAAMLPDSTPIVAHPRFLPHLAPDGTRPATAASVASHEKSAGALILWPHDALSQAGLRRHAFRTVLLFAAPESVQLELHQHLQQRDESSSAPIDVIETALPGRVLRPALREFIRACGDPNVAVDGDARWTHPAADWLRDEGLRVVLRSRATQLGLF